MDEQGNIVTDILCKRFGETNRARITDDTTMADIDGWDSLTYFDVVFDLEDAFEITFSEEEMTQLFQVGHIKRIVKAAKFNLPHEDEANAICQLNRINQNDGSYTDMMILSASSTREGLLRHKEAEAILQSRMGKKYRWFNLSVSGLVLSETIQLVEQISPKFKGTLIVGTSPVIWATCGVAEFERTVNFKRFPFAAPVMQNSLAKHGYTPKADTPINLMTVESWVERHLKGRNLDDLIYEPYLYPTLPPWSAEKFEDESAIALFYNNSMFNYRQSIEIHSELYYTLAELCKEKGITLVLTELTIHTKMRDFLERMGEVCSRYETFMQKFFTDTGLHYFDAAKMADINDTHFRDPAHLYLRQKEYTECFIDAAMPHMAKAA